MACQSRAKGWGGVEWGGVGWGGGVECVRACVCVYECEEVDIPVSTSGQSSRKWTMAWSYSRGLTARIERLT